MGYSIKILACDAADKDDLLKALAFKPTGQPDPENRTRFSGVVDGNWFFIWENLGWTSKLKEKHLIAASRAVPLMMFEVVETAMASRL